MLPGLRLALDLPAMKFNHPHMHKNPGILVLVLLFVAVLSGGGGVAYGLANLLVQIVALAALALNGDAVKRFAADAPKPLVGLVAITLLLPLLQLVPLPPQTWENLPGRDLLEEAIAAASAPGWRPLTVNTARTFVAFTGLIAPFAVLVFGWRSTAAALHRAVLALVCLGVASVLLGAFQVLDGGQVGLLYPEAKMPGVLFGLFANRNSTAIFLVSCLLLLCTLPHQRPLSPKWLAKLVAAVLLVTGVILTQSRTGLVLLALPAGLLVLQGVVHLAERKGRIGAARLPLGVGMIVLAGLAIVAGTVAGLPGSRLETVLARFEQTQEQRPLIWEDARFSVERYWPAGAGMGTFDEVFQIDESLENISPRRAGRAHNDYLELAVEAGPFALVIVLGWAVWTIRAAGLAVGGPGRWLGLASAGILAAVALQSLLDYPLRNQTMLCVTAFAVAVLARQKRQTEPAGGAAEGAA